MAAFAPPGYAYESNAFSFTDHDNAYLKRNALR